MTREEAIKELQEDIELYIPLHGTIDDIRDLPDGRLITALEMAIQALSQEPISLNDINNALGASFRNGVRSAKVEQEPCDDAISREAVLNTEYQIKEINGIQYVMLSEVQMKIRKAPSVTQKSGKWIDREFQSKIDGEIRNGWECSECGERFFRYDLINTDEFIPKYCPNCGAKMVEPQESESDV